MARAGLASAAASTSPQTAPHPTLPRFLHRAIVTLLRPAEAAARRLIITIACGIVVTLPPLRPRKPGPKTVATQPILRSLGIAVVMSAADIARAAAASRAAAERAAARPRSLSLPLLDPAWRPYRPFRMRHITSVPRISGSGDSTRYSPPPPPSPDDPVSAVRLHLRLKALAAALDDLPGHALRFARWNARRKLGLTRRTRPLKPGRAPGCRLARWDPTVPQGRRIREIDVILAHAHSLALYALNPPPDTS
jgi:hypothetical protein